MEDQAQSTRWKGKVGVELKGPTADQIWPFLEDFCNIHQWFPNLDTCTQVEGVIGKPDLVRYCASKSDGSNESEVKWVKEKLVMIDRIERCLSYEVTENNMGFKLYRATMKVLPVEEGSKIEMSFVADPVEGMEEEGLASYLDFCLNFMAKRMEQTLLSASDA
ncbi:lachrymatory-factor synthase [Tripterygium wilfordii]|uniref:Lachrymatory-factor synthase n=1 Tax=Tripterygium wilfordii TaxID=458696 RepID=A0A7J7BWX6_TRIWF|nr:lachrymatory-factor synthase [Tripterygium wilfordii]KAF5726185.1 lachrymatory-factor synthase [Tripterygium wilfordii]